MSRQDRVRKVRLSALAAAVSAAASPVQAADFVVTNKDVSGEGSLTAAIANANESAGVDNITFSVGGTIALDGYALPTITEGVVITGPGSGALTINAGDTSESTVFRVSLSSGNNTTISGLSVKNAPAGAVAVFDGGEGRAYLTDLKVTNSGTAEDPAFRPMIEVSESADATLTDVQIRNNRLNTRAPLGIYSAEADVVNTEITGNTSEYVAGGIFIAEGFMYMESSKVTGNTVEFDGPGGIAVKYGSSAQIYSSDISNNDGGPRGGGLSIRDSSITLIESTVKGNSAKYAGGGLYIESSEGFIGGSVIDRNQLTDTTESRGGGLAVVSGSLTLDETQITGNRANSGAGMSMLFMGMTVRDSVISGNVAISDGGGVLAGPSGLYLENSAITNNIAGTGENNGYGGGISGDGTSVILRSSTVRNNSASRYGGGLFMQNGNLNAGLSRIVDNSAENGGGLYLEGIKYIEMSGVTISNNTATESFGGLLASLKYSPGFVAANLDEVTIADNRSGMGPAVAFRLSGGSTEVNGDELNIWRSTLSGNRGVDAPAVVFEGNAYANLNIANSTLSGNQASGHRAAVSIADMEDTDIRFTTFVDNNGSGDGTTQLHLAGSEVTEGTAYIELSNSVLSSGNDDEVIIGGSELADDGYGYDLSVDVGLIANIMSSGFSQVGEASESWSSFGAVPGDPGLGALADNGGLTKTHAPVAFDGPTVDAAFFGRPDGIDQRGADQVDDGDLGAVEYVDNTPPRLILDLSKPLSGVVGREVPPLVVTDAFVDDEGDNIFVDGVEGLPPGLSYDGECEDAICGELEAAGEYLVTVAVYDDGSPSLTRTVQAVVKVKTSAAPPLFIDDDDDGGSVPLGVLALGGALAWLRRRR